MAIRDKWVEFMVIALWFEPRLSETVPPPSSLSGRLTGRITVSAVFAIFSAGITSAGTASITWAASMIPRIGPIERLQQDYNRTAERLGECRELGEKGRKVSPEYSRRHANRGRKRESWRGESLAKHRENKGQKRQQADDLRRRPADFAYGFNRITAGSN